MQTHRLGKSPIVVSKICMGTMTFGAQADEKMSHRILDMSLDAGINFFDTAENYPVPPKEEWAGTTEEIVGRWMKTKRRDELPMQIDLKVGDLVPVLGSVWRVSKVVQ